LPDAVTCLQPAGPPRPRAARLQAAGRVLWCPSTPTRSRAHSSSSNLTRWGPPRRSSCGTREPTGALRSHHEGGTRPPGEGGVPGRRAAGDGRSESAHELHHARRHAMASAARRGAPARIRQPRPWTEEAAHVFADLSRRFDLLHGRRGLMRR